MKELVAEYEEHDADSLWTLKFDHEPRSSPRWHPLQSGSRAVYRCVGARWQVVLPHSTARDDDTQQLLNVLESCGPLEESGAGGFDIRIGRAGPIWELSSPWLLGNPGPTFTSLTPEAIRAAFARLRDAENEPS